MYKNNYLIVVLTKGCRKFIRSDFSIENPPL